MKREATSKQLQPGKWDEGGAAEEWWCRRTARQILDTAILHRAIRGNDGTLVGFQRPPVEEHIAAIARALREPGARLRSPVVVGVIQNGGRDDGAYIVDGQQRLLACIRAQYYQTLNVMVARAGSISELRDLFVTVNNVRPLPRALVAEIVATAGSDPHPGDGTLALLIVEALNARDDSPLRGQIKRGTNPGGTISDAALVHGLRNSLAHGALSACAKSREAALRWGVDLIANFMAAVQGVFREAWEGLDARSSRLLHGTGTVAILHAMDVVHAHTGAASREAFEGPLLLLRPHCRWTAGAWDFADGTRLPWNRVQNVPAHRSMLSGHLAAVLRASIGAGPPA
jgi:hypothetical protein